MRDRVTTDPLRAPVSGPLRLYFVPCEPLEVQHAAELQAVVERFLDALRLGLLPGKLEAVRSIVRGDDGKVDARLEVRDLDPGALRVLYGTAIHFTVTTAPLGTIVALFEPASYTLNLFDTDVPCPSYSGPLPFDVRLRPRRAGVASPVVVRVVFGRKLDAVERDRFDRELRVWTALLHGGYPERGELPETSELGSFAIDYDEPTTLRLSADALLAGRECYEPLKALVARWAVSVPVMRLEVG